MRPFLVIAVAYLLGSVPFGYLVVRACKGVDVRGSGSGGTGATNVRRSAGTGAGALTLILDAAKGAAAVWLARLLLPPEPPSEWWITFTGISVILGHIFPVWLRFRGGKGVATGLGVFAVLAPLATVAAIIVFALVVKLTRFVSLASIAATLSIPLIVLFQHLLTGPLESFGPLLTLAVMGVLLIVAAHRGNIGRLIAGTEPRFRA